MTGEHAGSECVMGMDLGGTKINVAAVDRKGAILIERSYPSPSHDGNLMVSAFEEHARSESEGYAAEGLEVRGVGIAAAGYVLKDKGVMVEAPNIAWSAAPLRSIASEATGVPAFLDNDANAAAAGERLVGVARGIDDFVYLTLGTGIGGGVYANGSLLRGHRGMGAELGHMVINPSGPECGCGRRGCLEVFASGTALGRHGSQLVAGGKDTLLLELAGGDPDAITGRMVAAAVEEGDEVAARAMDTWAGYLATGIVNYMHVFEPEIFVLGGGVSESGHLFIENVRAKVLKQGIEAIVADIPVLISELGNKAGTIGAAALAWEGLSESR